MKKIEIKNQEALPQAAKAFIENMGDDTLFAFTGKMGAGKTTLIAEICRQLGVSDDISSPTFAIVNEYRSDTTAELIYHFDCYRLESNEEAEDMGIEDYFYSGALCFIEWPEKIEDFLPADAVEVHIEVNPDDSRTLTLEK